MAGEKRRDGLGWIVAVAVISFVAGRSSAPSPAVVAPPPAALLSNPDGTPTPQPMVEGTVANVTLVDATMNVDANMAGPADEDPSFSAPATAITTGFNCEGKRYCREMNSCEEAKFYLNQCGVGRLDGDGDERPCESIC